MKGKICIVTGGNTGIGKATVEGLAREGATVIVACRDLAKAEAAMTDIRARVPNADLRAMQLDLASLRSVRAFAAAFQKEHSRLDVLVENAGVSAAKRQLTADGFEMDFGVNHLGHFLLANELLPVLKESAPSRIVVVASAVHKGKVLNFDDLQNTRSYAPMRVYGESKLANMLFVRELSKRLEGTGVVVNAVHPGVIATELARDFPAPFRVLAKLFFKTPEKGARTSLHLATSPETGKVSGKYWVDSKIATSSPQAQDDAIAQKLWAESEKLIASVAAAN